MKKIFILILFLIFVIGCAKQQDNIEKQVQVEKTPEDIVAEQEYQPPEFVVNKPRENFTIEKY